MKPSCFKAPNRALRQFLQSFLQGFLHALWPVGVAASTLLGLQALQVLEDSLPPALVFTFLAWMPVPLVGAAWTLYQRANRRLRPLTAPTLALLLASLIAILISGLLTVHLGEELLSPSAGGAASLTWDSLSWDSLSWSLSWPVLTPFLHAQAGLVTTLGTTLGGLALYLYDHRTCRQVTTHGSARLATLKEIRGLATSSAYGLPLGFLPHPYTPYDPLRTLQALKRSSQRSAPGTLLKGPPAHTLVIAPSGAGKGVGYVIPTLLEYAGGVLVTDIKGENVAVTARWRESRGQSVRVLDPFQLTDPSLPAAESAAAAAGP